MVSYPLLSIFAPVSADIRPVLRNFSALDIVYHQVKDSVMSDCFKSALLSMALFTGTPIDSRITIADNQAYSSKPDFAA